MSLSPTVTCLRALPLVLLLAGPALAGTPAEIRADDVITKAQQKVKLRAKLWQKGVLGGDVTGEPLDFYLIEHKGTALEPATYLGSGKTDGDGWGEHEWLPERGAGPYRVEARVRRGSKYVASPGRIQVVVTSPSRAVVVVQVDQTVSSATNFQLWVRGTRNKDIPCTEGAKETLTNLARTFELVYVTDLDEKFSSRFKDWLELNEIPPAPVLFWDVFSRSLSHATFMKRLIGQLAKDVPGLALGIGGQIADAEAFLEHGLNAVVLSKPDDLDADELTAAMVTAETWKDVQGHVDRMIETAQLLEVLALGKTAAAQPPAKTPAEALAKLSLLGDSGLGYVQRWRRSSNERLAAAASQVAGRLAASQAFFETLDRSTPDRALSSFVAAWREHDPAVIRRLYKEPARAAGDALPAAVSAHEIMTRNEPEPGRVEFKLRLTLAGGQQLEKVVTFVEHEKTWWIGQGDF